MYDCFLLAQLALCLSYITDQNPSVCVLTRAAARPTQICNLSWGYGHPPRTTPLNIPCEKITPNHQKFWKTLDLLSQTFPQTFPLWKITQVPPQKNPKTLENSHSHIPQTFPFPLRNSPWKISSQMPAEHQSPLLIVANAFIILFCLIQQLCSK